MRTHGWEVRSWSRRAGEGPDDVIFTLGKDVDPVLFDSVDALIHCAYDFGPREWNQIRDVNVSGTQKLFEAAKRARVRSIVFISSLSAFPGCRSLYGKAKLEIEKSAYLSGVLIVRPGLVYGDSAGGVFGKLVEQVKRSRFVPTLLGGRQTQFLIHQDDLATFVIGYLTGQIRANECGGPICAANEHGWQLKEIMVQIAGAVGKQIFFVPVPWQLAWLALKGLEIAGWKNSFRSDNLIGLVYQNPHPSFRELRTLGFECRPFQMTRAMAKKCDAESSIIRQK